MTSSVKPYFAFLHFLLLKSYNAISILIKNGFYLQVIFHLIMHFLLLMSYEEE